MSYIHIGIPVNLTTVQHSISLFHTYLDTFTSLTTSHSDKQQFARVISELATLAQNKLSKCSARLRSLDHILPSDTSSSPIHKRFVDGISFEVCKAKDHHVRVELDNCNAHLTFNSNQLTLCKAQLNHFQDSSIPNYSYLSLKPNTLPPLPPRQGRQFWMRQLANCRAYAKDNANKLSSCHNENYSKNLTLSTCLSQLESHNKDIFHKKQNPLRLPFSNLTRTPTTTTPKPTTYPYYPFAPTRAPYHGTTSPPSRHTRQVVAAVALVSGVLGTFLGLFNNREVDDIQNNLLTLTDQHNILTTVVKKHEHELSDLHSQLSHLTNTVEALILYNPSLVYALLEDTVISIKDKIESLFDTLQQLQNQRLAVTLLDEHQMHVIWDSALNSAKTLNVKLLPTRSQDLFQLDASYVRKDNEVLILLHIPCVSSDEMLSLYEYVPFPYPLRYDPSHPNPAPGQLLSFQDLANSPYSSSDSALYFHSDFNLIAIGRNTDINIASYKLITQAELDACIQKNHIYLCENHQTLRKDLTGTCLGSLYLQHEEGVVENCQINQRPLREATHQLSSTTHLVFSPKPLTTQILCKNGTHFPQKLYGTTYITVPPFCKINLVNHTISSDGNTRITPDPLIFEWHLQPNLLPLRLLTASSHIDLILNELHSNLTNFRSNHNDSISDDQFTKLLHSHLTTPSASAAIIWTSVITSLLAASVIVVCLATFWIRRRKERNRRRRLPFTDMCEPMSILYAPSADSEEDEISYIARTGNVRPSAPRPIVRRIQK